MIMSHFLTSKSCVILFAYKVCTCWSPPTDVRWEDYQLSFHFLLSKYEKQGREQIEPTAASKYRVAARGN